jgi:LuxR family maltose regulon positive regulatory protein
MTAPSGPPTPLRHEPPRLTGPLVTRGRLLQVLRGRFDRRLTVITAGAGFGKTTLLAQAVQENALERFGTDVWLRLDERDRDPEHLLVGLFRSVTDEPARAAIDIGQLCELLWLRSPDAVAVILDDVHLLDDRTRRSWELVDRLLDELPDNAHLVLSGRTLPPFALRHRQLGTMTVSITEAELAFDDDELVALARAFPTRDHNHTARAAAERLPRWPALAVLNATLGHEASIDYLRSELVAGLEPERRRLLALAAPFPLIDDALVVALGHSDAWTANRLIGALPLVERSREGGYRLHALWADALRDAVDDAERAEALRRGAALLRGRSQWHQAAQASTRANDFDGIRAAVRGFCEQPLVSLPVSAVLELQAVLPNEDRTAPMGLLLEGMRHWATNERLAATLFARAAQAAQLTGDEELEVLARWRGVQLHYLDDHDAIVPQPRLRELSQHGHALARAVTAFIDSIVAQREGRIDDSLTCLDDFVWFEAQQREVTVNERMVDLGRPEAIAATIESVLGTGVVDFFGAQALWLRGEVLPELAWPLSADVVRMADVRGVIHEQVSVNCVVALVGLAAGATEEATTLLKDALMHESVVGDQVALLIDIGEAHRALHSDGDDAARAILHRALDRVPLGRSPSRGHLHGLCALRALVPDTADLLDTYPFGPSLQVGVDAGAALDALRRRGDRDPARALPWHRAGLLRAQVPVPFLTELALAAGHDGDTAALDVLQQVPHRATWLARIAGCDHRWLASSAERMLGELPTVPGYRLSVRLLGDIDVQRDDGRPLDANWHRRTRVKDLFAFIVAKRRTTRAAAAHALWPALHEAKAAANLRVNLAHLHNTLEPDRRANDRTWFVHADGSFLRLGEDGIDIDVDRFDRLIADARRAEGDGLPSVALACYAEAMTTYGGDYLANLDEEWVWAERLRLRSLAHAATCRYGELVLARGEPEQAISAAVRAQELDHASERAHRLFIRCHVALGSLSTAREAGRALAERLRRDGLTAEEETRHLLRRLERGG